MKLSTDRIITTHAGSLPRPPEPLKLVQAKVAGQPFDDEKLAAEVARSVEALTKMQADLGLDVVSDGEMSKPSFLGYITERLGGVRVTTEPFGNPWKGSRENKSFPEYYAWEASLNLNPAVGAKRVVCDGPL
jgi:5-methyltetrahydropteroyltriglutamate--homocysteine methyltransferase